MRRLVAVTGMLAATALLASCAVSGGSTDEGSLDIDFQLDVPDFELTLPPLELSAGSGLLIGGVLVEPDGSPAVAAEVHVAELPSLGDTVFGLFTTAMTGGLACLADPPPVICDFRGSASTVTDDTGRFVLDVAPEFAERFSGDDARLIGTAVPAGGGAVTFTFVPAGREVVELPVLQTWVPSITQEQDGERLLLRWSDAPAREVRVMVGAEDALTGPPALTWPAAGTATAVDARFLEDRDGFLALRATGTTDDVGLEWTTPALRLRGTSGPPPSRGAPCMLDGVEQVPCPVTDAEIATTVALGEGFVCPEMPGPPPLPEIDAPGAPALPELPEPRAFLGCDADPVSELVVDLGSEQDIGLVVTQGCPCSVDVSDDGASYRPLTTRPYPGLVPSPLTALEAEGSGRFVRLTPRSGVGVLLGEVAVWPPARAVAPDGALLPAPGSSALPWRLVAVVLAGVALVGGAYALGRRRSASNPVG